ncbi:hypothetical protein MSP7336_00665 [Mycobacterium shimoidei]|uniref:VWFA domain-containing protein n=1 Tax=Mycobacterium shimoidei TaxID=29313 RepID=A0A375YUP6_MYCSH|nr:VWA domain-containing protein [Mycobacterium shimoidei]SRX92440.1 hypothetical protein MSP7336_00665 [Mycobacterium shimoidei]
MNSAGLLRGVDAAAFATALAARLRGVGVLVSPSGPANFVQALRELLPHSRSELYWAVRLTLINRMEDLAAFDAVFEATIGDPVVGDPPAPQRTRRTEQAHAESRDRAGSPSAAALPWATRASGTTLDRTDPSPSLPELLPSRFATRADEPFDQFDRDDLRRLGSWLEASVARWPRRHSLRHEPSPLGKAIDLRRTMNASQLTGWEPLILARTRRRRRHRRVVLVCDVSRSMRPYTTVYLHLMRAAVLRRAGIRPEVFAFSTSLTRLTAVLSHRSPEVALERANAKVTDRYSGTHIARSLGALLTAPHGNLLRGAVVIVASDGWDSYPPDLLAHALARVHRRAELLVWLNPRAAQRDFQPLAGSMAAALPYCDLFLPAHSLTGLQQLFLALASAQPAGQDRFPWIRYGPTGRSAPKPPSRAGI